MRFKLIGMLFLMAIAISVSAAEITGIVTDKRTGRVVSGAWVTNGKQQVYTNEKGRFSLECPESVTVIITVHAQGFMGWQKQVSCMDTGEPVPIRIELEEDRRLTETILVIGESQAVLPGPGLSRGREQLYRQSDADVGEFIRKLPGAAAIRKGGTALDPVFRGFQRDQLRVVVDGAVEVEGACPNRMDPPVTHFALTDLNRIELHNGPFSVRYGPSLGGVLNLVMASDGGGMTGMSGMAGFGYVSNGQRTAADFRLAAGTDRAGVRISGSYGSGSDYEDGSGNDVDAAYHRDSATVQLSFQPMNAHLLTARYHHVYLWDVAYPALPMDADDDKTDVFSMGWQWKRMGRMDQVKLDLYASRVDHTMSNRKRSNLTMMFAETVADTATDGGRVECRFMLEKGTVYAGLDHRKREKDGIRTRDMFMGPMAGQTVTDRIWPDAWTANTGTFVDYRGAFGDDALFSLGMRVDQVRADARSPMSTFTSIYGDELSDSQILFSLNFGWDKRITDSLSVGIHAGQGNRAPDISERFLFLLPTGVDRYDYLGNPLLKAERNRQVEFSASWSRQRMTARFAVFYADLDHAISAVVTDLLPSRSPGVFGVKQFINIDDALRWGLELGVQYQVWENLQLSLDGVFAAGRDQTHQDYLPETPPAELLFTADYAKGNGRLKWISRAVERQDHVSESFGEPVTPGFTTHQLAFHYRFRSWEMIIQLFNLTDKAYAEHLSRRLAGTGLRIAEPGRSAFIGMRTTF